jgi:hypothetical protein
MKSLSRPALLLILLLPLHLSAGWIITGRYIDRDGKTVMKRYFIQDDQIKVERFNLIYSCNLKTGAIVIVDPEKLIYVKTSLTAYTEKLTGLKMERLRELLSLIPESEKAGYKRLYEAQTRKELILAAGDGDSLSIVPLADTATLLGHKTVKYNILENGLKKEELFYTDEVDISAAADMNAFLQYVYLLEPEDKTLSYVASKKYTGKFKNGLVIRRFMFSEGYRTEWQVNKIQQKDIPAYEFGVPDLCKELPLDKWLARQNDTDDQYYDDYE